ncbi:hypothetical protein ACH0BF_13360 [Pseudobacillus sp. 179-B 2D1 NHS]|uniref:hypothetical protein n=1 Tax=Pseudobacillus sp. 179-B 2D1 NHS TaxID=3374292 RepID=UPI00387A7FD5
MKKGHIFWLMSLFLSFLGFYNIEHLFTIKPDETSGNGNLGMLVILAFSPIFAMSCFLTYKLVRGSVRGWKMRALILVLSTASCLLLILLVISYKNELVVELGGPPDHPQSKIYRFGWINQYTNSIYFNAYTFFFIHLLAVMVGLLSTIKRDNPNESVRKNEK